MHLEFADLRDSSYSKPLYVKGSRYNDPASKLRYERQQLIFVPESLAGAQCKYVVVHLLSEVFSGLETIA